jgi:hypothetical protein
MNFLKMKYPLLLALLPARKGRATDVVNALSAVTSGKRRARE